MGQWVAARRRPPAGGGRDGRAVYEAARAAGVRSPLVTRVEPPFAGW